MTRPDSRVSGNEPVAIEHDGWRYHLTCTTVNAYEAERSGGGLVFAANIEDPEEICKECWAPLLGPPERYD